ncbi:MAG: hypothetical protein KGQ40_14305, partial [Rhodospirillales bacterium]|nr:hypothetical protein [Rhodospirillales bacterium]
LIADRLARLPRALRRVVQLCAVIGAEVPLGLAAAVTGIAPKALHATLLKLQGEQLLYEMRRHPEPLFAFKHALTRDVAYRTLLAAQRRAHHARIVAFLEGDGGVQDAQRLADLCVHTIQAQLWPKAVTYLRKAAGPAAERGAYRLAVGYLERAIEIVRRLPDDDAAARTQMELLLEHGVVQTHVGGYRQSSASLAAAQALAARLDDGPASLRIHSLQVHVFNILGQLDEAVALGQRTRALARQAGNTALALYATFFLGQSFHNAGRLREAEAMLTENLAMIAAGAEPNLAVFHGTITVLTHGTRAMSRAFLGDFAGAHADYEAARTQAVSSGRPYDKVFALGTRSFSLLHQRSAQSEASFRDAIEAAETLSVAQLLIPLQTGLGQALLMGPDLATASATLSAAHRAAREGSRTMYQINAAIGLVVAGLRMGEPDLARSFAAEACDLAARAGFQGCQVAALRARGLALAAMAGGEDEALALLAQACALGEALGMRADVAHAHAALAALRQAGHLEEAERRYAALGMEEWFTVIRADIAADRVPYL